MADDNLNPRTIVLGKLADMLIEQELLPHKIPMIRLAMEHTSLGIRDAKELTDTFERELSAEKCPALKDMGYKLENGSLTAPTPKKQQEIYNQLSA